MSLLSKSGTRPLQGVCQKGRENKIHGKERPFDIPWNMSVADRSGHGTFPISYLILGVYMIRDMRKYLLLENHVWNGVLF